MTLLQVVFSLFLCASGQNCTKYVCAQAGSDGTECMRMQDGTVYVSECQQGYFCPPVEGFQSVTCEKEDNLQPLSWPGEFCTSNQSCITTKCVASRCTGGMPQDPCVDHSDCDVALFCGRFNVCEPQLFGASSMPCRDDFDCRNYLSCQRGRCIHYMTLTEGEVVHNCQQNRSLACESTLCTNSRCLKQLQNDNQTLPVTCASEDDCVSNWYSTDSRPYPVKMPCNCGLTGDGRKVCDLFPGDAPYSDFRKALFHFVDAHRNWPCHTLRRFSLQCMQGTLRKREYEQLAKKYLLAEYFGRVAGSEMCVLKVFVPEYFRLIEQGAWVALAGIGVIAIS